MNPQTFNPYVYCMNNPMKYIDPNGESFLSALGFLFGSSNPFGWIALGIIGTALVAKMVYDYYHRDRLN